MPTTTVRAEFKVPPEPPPSQQQPAAAPASQSEPRTSGEPQMFAPVTEVLVDGQPLSTAFASALTSVEVQQSLSLVDMAVLTFDNPEGKIGDAPTLSCGKELEVKMGYLGKVVSLFKGDIVALEPSYPIEGKPFVVVRAYDRKHRLRRGRKQRVFLNQKVSDIAQTIASEEGLSADIEDTGVQHPYLIQNNQTNIDFLHELGRRYHVEVRVAGVENKLVVKKPKSTEGPTAKFKWGENLKSFYVKKSVANVPTEVEVRTWDMVRKSTISSTAQSLHGKLGSSSVLDEAKKAFGAAKRLIAIRPTLDQQEASAMASSVLNEEAMNAVKGRGTIVGDTSVVPGMVIELEGLGQTWSGKYYVTGATHVYHHVSGYATQFEVKRNG